MEPTKSQKNASRLVIDPTAIPMASGYSMHLYCDRINLDHSYNEFPHEYFGETFSEVAKQAKGHGWKIHKNGFATCPKCTKI